MMNCSDCAHGIVLNAALDRDSELRDIISCDLLCREVKQLSECSRYQELKKVVVEEIKKVEPQIVDLGYGAVPKKKGWPLGKKRGA